MKGSRTILPVLLVFLSACSSSASFSGTLETMLGEIVDSDSEKKEIMGYYKKAGGAKASKERGRKACEALGEGEDIGRLAITLNHLDEPYEALGLTQPWGNSEFEKAKVAGKLYLAEVYTAQQVFCPDTKVELDL